jgi:N-acyl homoserine lactone hydrolase
MAMTITGNSLPSKTFPKGEIRRLYILDYGLFQVHDNGRIIGIAGYLIQTQDGDNILVDTGFPAWYIQDPAAASLEDDLGSFGSVLRLDSDNLPAGQLATVGLKTSDIDLLVMTHGDIDHVGGLAEFQRQYRQATIGIGRAERALERPRYFGDRRPIAWPDGADYWLVDGDEELCPGVALLSTPGHSPGHLSLLLRLPRTGVVLLTADAIARPAEFEEGFGGAWDEAQARASAERLMAIADKERAMIIYGHDPDQWKTLPKAPEYYS